MAKVMFIDSGFLVKNVVSLFMGFMTFTHNGLDSILQKITVAFDAILEWKSPERIMLERYSHVSFTAKAFLDEYPDAKDILAYFCLVSAPMEDEDFAFCVKKAIENDIKYINVSFGPGITPLYGEQELLNTLMRRGHVIVYAQGNDIKGDIDELYPNKFCLEYNECYLAAAEEVVSKGYAVSRKAVVIKSRTCIQDVCQIGSSFAAPKLLARIIKRRHRHE